MIRSQALDIINQIENEFEVNSILYNGVKIWPILRVTLFIQLEQNEFYPREKENKTDNKSIRKNIIIDVLYIIKQFFLESIKKEFIKPLLFNKSYHKAKIVFLGISSHRTEKVQNKYFHKVFDSLIHYIKNKKEVVFLELIEKGNKEPFYSKSLILNQKMTTYYYKQKFKNINLSVTQVDGLDEFKSYLLERYKNLNLNTTEILYRLNRIFTYKDYFIKLFKKLNNKYLFLDIYYFDKSMGAILAAKHLNILTCEIQHGSQGPETVGHGRWECMPKDGYRFFPDIFWVWDEFSFKNIISWSKNTNCHNAILGGNPFLAYINDYYQNSFKKKKDKKYLLFTMQALTIEEKSFFEEVVCKIINIDLGLNWIFRLHPNHINNQKLWLENFFLKHNMKNVEIQMPEESLVDVLMGAQLHMTFFSTVALEAFTLGKKNVILGQNGVEYYKDYLSEDTFLFIEDDYDLENKFLNFMKVSPPKNNLNKHSKRVVETLENIIV